MAVHISRAACGVGAVHGLGPAWVCISWQMVVWEVGSTCGSDTKSFCGG